MLGAIIGDMVGSVYEFDNTKRTDFPFFSQQSTYTDDIRKTYGWEDSCQGTVPPAIRAFLDSSDFESAVRIAVSLGGDSDTLACITGGIAEAYYQSIPDDILIQATAKLPAAFRQELKAFRDASFYHLNFQ